MRHFWSIGPPILAILTLGLIVLAGCSGEEGAESIVEPETIQSECFAIKFDQALTFEELALLSAKYDLSVEEIRGEFEDFTWGYSVSGRDLLEVKPDFLKEHRKFLELMSTYVGGVDSVDKLLVEASSLCSELLARGGSDVLIEPIVVFRGKVDENLLKSPAVTLRDDIVVFPPGRELDSEVSPETPAGAPQSYWHERWAPYGGSSKVTQWLTLQTFAFNNTSDFTYTRTYEHETQIYDRNFADYAGYWATNMPYGYKDTQYGDSIDNFTVGCARAERLSAFTTYWTYMSLSPQSSPTALCRIKGQIGHRYPSWCYSTWCIFPDATSGSLAYLALPNYGVCWQY